MWLKLHKNQQQYKLLNQGEVIKFASCVEKMDIIDNTSICKFLTIMVIFSLKYCKNFFIMIQYQG